MHDFERPVAEQTMVLERSHALLTVEVVLHPIQILVYGRID